VPSLMTHSGHRLHNRPPRRPSGLMPGNLITLPHLSVSAATNMPTSAGENMSGLAPRPASRAFNTGLASATLISLLSWLMIVEGVFFRAPTPCHVVASFK
jgi:hypothetical protein